MYGLINLLQDLFDRHNYAFVIFIYLFIYLILIKMTFQIFVFPFQSPSLHFNISTSLDHTLHQFGILYYSTHTVV